MAHIAERCSSIVELSNQQHQLGFFPLLEWTFAKRAASDNDAPINSDVVWTVHRFAMSAEIWIGHLAATSLNDLTVQIWLVCQLMTTNL